MRTLIVSRSTPSHEGFGGMERVTWDLARSIAQAGDVTVLTTPAPGRDATWIEDGVKVITFPGLESGRYSRKWWVETARYTEARHYDSVISASAGATAMVHFQRGPEYTFHAHGTAKRELQNVLRLRPQRWPLKVARYLYWMFLDRLTYGRVDRVIAASEQVEGALREWPYRGAWRRTQLEIIPNTVDARHFAPDEAHRKAQRERWNLAADVTVISTISRLTRQKGVDRVIDALASCTTVTHLLIAGSGEEEGALREQAESLGITDRVTFIGHVDYHGVREVLHASDVFVLPVRNFAREAMPVSVLEALAAGVRTIVPTGSTWPAPVANRLEFVDVGVPMELAMALDARGVATQRSAY